MKLTSGSAEAHFISSYDLVLQVCHTLLRYETGDAAGQNMTTICSWEVTKWVNENAPKELGTHIRFFTLEGKMG